MRPVMETGPLPRLVDHYKMANQAQELEGSIPLSEFARLRAGVSGDEGEVHLRLAFSKSDDNRTHVSGRASTAVTLVCQNCMSEFTLGLNAEIDAEIVADEAELSSLEDEQDGLVSAERVVALTQLVEDELMLAVPMIPRHKDADCPGNAFQPVTNSEPAGSENTHRPFAGLAEAMKTGKKPES